MYSKKETHQSKIIIASSKHSCALWSYPPTPQDKFVSVLQMNNANKIYNLNSAQNILNA